MKKNRRVGFCLLIKTSAVLIAFSLTALNFGRFLTNLRKMPDAFYAESEAELIEKISGGYSIYPGSISAESTGDERLGNREAVCKLFGRIVLKSVPAVVSQRPILTPGGQPVGISIYTDGVLVVGTGSFISDSGQKADPAKDAGIIPGDVILSVNGSEVATSKDLQNELSRSKGSCVLKIDRNGKRLEISVVPYISEDGSPRIGAWVRDSTVGIGTLSFYDPDTRTAAALGQAVVDSDTGSLLKVKDGKLVLAEIIGVSIGRQGVPGELRGTFGDFSPVIGQINTNTELGIFGSLSEEAFGFLEGNSIETAFPDEVHIGDAVLISCADGQTKEYSCRIIKTGRQNEPQPKGLVIEITDETLLALTGGIVQGMSGSPVIQDGRLVGVITHVFVNEPRRGYGAYAFWMYKRSGGQ